MKINSLIKLMSSGYPDDYIAQSWSFKKRQPLLTPNGDGLAWFLANEMFETFDPIKPDKEQLGWAMTRLESIADEIAGVKKAVQEALDACKR